MSERILPCLSLLASSFDLLHSSGMFHGQVTDVYDIYIYHEGYLRTSSETFSLDLRASTTAASGGGTSQMVHLTNYCMQKHSKNLGKFEEGNTLKYDDLQVLLCHTSHCAVRVVVLIAEGS